MTSVKYSNPIKVEVGGCLSMRLDLLPAFPYVLGKEPCLAEDPARKPSFTRKVQSDFFVCFHIYSVSVYKPLAKLHYS